MNTHPPKFCGWALVLVALGLLALYVGPRGLPPLIGAAIVVWYIALEPATRNRRN